MTEINDRIEQLRERMQEQHIDVYVVCTSDFHTSEYVGEYFKERAFITGFTGSAGTAVITATEAGLWTDGRYFIQAAHQIEGTGVKLYPMGEQGVPTVTEYIREILPQEGCIGFDGRCVNVMAAREYQKLVEEVGGSLSTGEDLIAEIWVDRPPLAAEPLWILQEEYAGESTRSKLDRIGDKMRNAKVDAHLINSLYDIAWILNLRGNDIAHVPVFLSYLWISEKDTILYVQKKAVSQEVTEYLQNQGIQLHEYQDIYQELQQLSYRRVLIDPQIVNKRLYQLLAIKHKGQNVQEWLQEDVNPSEWMRVVKNETEIRNTRLAHIKDGVAFTRFMYYLKQNIGKIPMTEVTASDYLEECRRQQEHFLDVSFDTISAYGANAAMMHYSASEDHCASLRPEGFLLVDSGGHYLEGTTDITRTIALGPITDKMRVYFTTVLRCNLRLATAHFPKGCVGQNLDILARGPVWDMGLDYRCGTGHGVGHILNVHEGPNAFRWRMPKDGRVEEIVPGMITTDEPGLYIEDEFGIRTENELLCVLGEKTEYGQFLQFEPLTFAPIDLDAVDVTLLTDQERDALNDYHQQVYEQISPFLSEDEKTWLKEITRKV